jgi:ribonucleotide reductase beta subunit family protein with ferritin-like domain
MSVQKSDYECLCDENYFRLTTFPIEPSFDIVWNLYKKQLESFWKAEEIDFSNDYKDYQLLSPEEQHFIKMILAFFAASDGIVNFNIRERFMNEIKVTEVQIMLGFQYMMENIHGEVYSNMLNNIVKKKDEREYLFNAIKNIDSIKNMKDWAFKWIHSKENIGYVIVAASIIEGVFFSGAFASIFWLKLMRGRNKLFMEGLVKSNKLISRDEGLHTNADAVMYSFINSKIPQNIIYEMINDAVLLTDNFHSDGIRIDMIGMNLEMMKNYVRYVSDRLLVLLGYEKLYNVTNPFHFMELIGMNSKDNFFETRPDAYQSAFNENNENWNFELTDDF